MWERQTNRGLAVEEYAENSPAAAAYRRLAREVLTYAQDQPKIENAGDLFAMDDETRPVQQEQNETAPLPENAVILRFIPPDSIRHFYKHPFRLYEGKRLDDLVTSITANGILTPVIIRKIEKDENPVINMRCLQAITGNMPLKSQSLHKSHVWSRKTCRMQTPGFTL